MGGIRIGENTLANEVVESLEPGFLGLADRNFFSFSLWSKALETGADLLWRVKKDAVLPVEERLEDGSYLSHVYRSTQDRKKKRHCRPGSRVSP